MSSYYAYQKRRGLQASKRLFCGIVLIHLFAAQINTQESKSPWQTLSGDAPRVIARGGFSGLFPDSSLDAYKFAMYTSVEDVVLWCDVQLTKDALGICFPDLTMINASNIESVYPNRQNSYPVNGVPTSGWFTIDFSMRDLYNVSLIRGILSRSEKFDKNGYDISTIENVTMQIKPQGLWLNVQHDEFYEQHNLSMSSFLLSASRTVSIDFISSPEVNFFRKIAGGFGHNGPSFVFQFLRKEDFEPTTNRTYGSILSNLTFVKTFASGILVPKSYVLPLDDKLYLLPHTSLVQDAHKAGLQVYVSGFANDIDIAYNYSFDPVSEYLSFVDNGDFSVDGMVSDFPNTASASVDCFSHIGRDATNKVEFLVISRNGASGDYPGCTNLAYEKAIKDGADVIDCLVQMSSDAATVNPFRTYSMFRNPKERNSGKLISLSEFLNLAKNFTSLSGVLINVENAAYLREKQRLDVVKAVLDTLTDTGYSNTKVMIQSTNSSVLIEIKKQSQYETVYKIDEDIGGILDYGVEEIKKFADAVVIGKSSVFPYSDSFLTGQTNVVERLKKSQLPVYVELFQNEFVSTPYDFFSDATVEINTYISRARINGTITEFPFTAARYKRNRCLGRKEIPTYMSPVQPGALLKDMSPQSLPPAEAPNLIITDADVIEPSLPPVSAKAPNLAPGDPSTNAQAPSGQIRLTLSLVLSVFFSFSFTYMINL